MRFHSGNPVGSHWYSRIPARQLQCHYFLASTAVYKVPYFLRARHSTDGLRLSAVSINSVEVAFQVRKAVTAIARAVRRVGRVQLVLALPCVGHPVGVAVGRGLAGPVRRTAADLA